MRRTIIRATNSYLHPNPNTASTLHGSVVEGASSLRTYLYSLTYLPTAEQQPSRKQAGVGDESPLSPLSMFDLHAPV